MTRAAPRDDSHVHRIPLDSDDVFEALRNIRRRRVILSLDQSDGTVSTGDLAVELAAKENLVDPSTVTSDQRTRVYTALIQVHLNTLDDAGVINYDAQSKQVYATDATAGLAEIIRQIESSCYSPEPEPGGEVDT